VNKSARFNQIFSLKFLTTALLSLILLEQSISNHSAFAAQNLYTGATLSKASWSIDPAWAGKSYSCTTTSYAAGAVGIANS
jgi:hypothetical protein